MSAKVVLVTGSALVPRSTCYYIENRGYHVRRVEQDHFTSEELHLALRGVSGYLIGGYEEVLAEHFERNRGLEAVGWVGTDYKANVPGWRRAGELGIEMVGAPGANATSVAEFTILLTLAISRPFVRSVMAANGSDHVLAAAGADLHGRLLGIIGLGRIGARVARIARHGFAMDVVYHAPRRNLAAEQALDIGYRAKRDLLSSCDVITIHRPGPEKGEKPELGRAEFELMPAGVLLINAAHHGLVDLEALRWAIETKQVRAAFDGVIDDAAWRPLVALGPERFLAVPPMAFNTSDANLRASMRTAEAVCDILDRNGPAT